MRKIYLFFIILIFANVFSNENSFSNFQIKRKEIERNIYTNQKKAYQDALELLDFAKKSNSKQLIADAYSCLAYIEMGRSNFKISFTNNTISFEYNKKINNQKELAYNYFNFCKINIRKADFENCLRNAQKTIELASIQNNFVLVQRTYNTLAVSYYLQKDFEKGVFYAEKALKLQIKASNYESKGYSLGTIALNYWEIYCKNNQKPVFEKSEKYFIEAVTIFKKNKDVYNLGWALSNWSYIYQKKDLEKSIILKLNANKNFESLKTENYGTLTNLGNIAISYDKLSQNDSLIQKLKSNYFPKNKELLENSAESYYLQCNNVCIKLKSLAYYQVMLKKYAEFQFRKNQTKKAYENLALSYKINDSIFSQESKNAIAKLESQKEIDKKNQQIKINNLALEAKEKQKWFYVTGIGFLAIIGGLLFYQSRKRKLNNLKLGVLNKTLDQNNIKLETLNKDLDQANKAKTRFFGILNHDLRGPVANLINFLQLQKESPEMLDEASTKRMQDKTMTGAENLLASMEDILQWSKSQMENFKPQPKKVMVKQLFEDTKKVFSGYLNIKFEYQNPDDIEIFTDDNYLKTIIRNLTSNAINVFTNIENPTIIWKAWQENSVSYLSITDNGPGADAEKLKALFEESEVSGTKSGLGLHLIRDMAKAINCEISVESEIGFGTTFVLKI